MSKPTPHLFGEPEITPEPCDDDLTPEVAAEVAKARAGLESDAQALAHIEKRVGERAESDGGPVRRPRSDSKLD